MIDPNILDKARMIVQGHESGALRNITSVNEDRLEFAKALLAVPEAFPPNIAALAEEIRSMPRYDCAGPEGDYDAGMESGDGYVDYYELLKVLERYAPVSPLVTLCPYPIQGDDGSAKDCISKDHCGCDERKP